MDSVPFLEMFPSCESVGKTYGNLEAAKIRTVTVRREDMTMRAYLESFFKEFSYLPEDGAVLLDAYDRIAADGESHAAWQQALALYDSSYDCDYPEILRLANVAAERLYLHEYTVELLIFLCLSKKAREYYRAQNIEDRIYHDTMLDLRYKLEECKLVKGVVGSFVAGWFIGFFNLTRFSFGRLSTPEEVESAAAAAAEIFRKAVCR